MEIDKTSALTGLLNQVALVTGAGSGIGKAIALALAAHETKLWLVGRTESKLRSVAASAGQRTDPHCLPVDLAYGPEIMKLAEKVQGNSGRLDILIHCAAHIALGSLEKASVDELDRHYQVNVRAPYLLTQALLPLLRKHRGQIVFINSSTGLATSANTSQYSASKFALRALADSLRQEVNEEGIRVLSIFPGRTASPLQAAVHAMEGKEYHPDRLMHPDDVASVVVNALAMPRSAEVTEIHMRPFLKS